ncbi:MAG: hypothetical protein LBM98_00695 [Oscillospiraceae bacterium]|jgi:hypothetical protein|nr:hypothetical protein [Oscillospiraceae bacterium]
MIKQYQSVRLKNGKRAVIVELLEQGKAYIGDIEIADGDFDTDFIYQDDIASVFVEVEQPLLSAAS